MKNLWKGIAILGIWVSYAYLVPQIQSHSAFLMGIGVGLITLSIANDAK